MLLCIAMTNDDDKIINKKTNDSDDENININKISNDTDDDDDGININKETNDVNEEDMKINKGKKTK